MPDERGVKKKKGRSNEVSLSFAALIGAEAPLGRLVPGLLAQIPAI
jgi:hypothetical protein